ncbi:F-box only protein 3-like [Haliotis rubra]|uniref:F-box only protein 3-like n=1 Tax=Haliotis rubra TaxID=36100 RepID=UPI001EE5CEA3|nr:F-box only protein 3-like [Haliotis rubra]XP_046556248.1 F-box only protein 3-like [Haliotis rubra]
MACGSSTLLHFPSEILLQVFQHVDYKDLVNLSLVNNLFCNVATDDSLWKIQCDKCFMLQECPEDSTWKELFLKYYGNYGDVLGVYIRIRTAWNKIMGYLKKYDKVITSTLLPPATEEQLREAESKLGCRFPDDMRCSLKIYNGQKQGAGPGLLGCIAISTHFRSEKLLDCKTIAENFSVEDDSPFPGCTPITYCCMTQRCQLMSFREEYGIPNGQIFFPCADGDSKDDDLDAFICGNTYTEWLEELAELMDKEIFYRIKGCHFRFLDVPDCVRVTRDMFTVKVGTCFMPDLSTVHPPSFFYVYRITMKMHDDAPRKESCQLLSRYWSITDMDGNEEIMEGPGVVGENPVLIPGEEFSWESGTTFPTTYGNMKGHFVMINLEKGTEFRIECPVFHMKCLPYETSAQRKERVEERKKNL